MLRKTSDTVDTVDKPKNDHNVTAESDMENYLDLEQKKWQTWASDCPVKSGLLSDMCFVSGDKCQIERCFAWKLRALVKSEPTP